ncbi:MAG: D-lyxose/D-mannose family sugar isomerase [Paludibacter sp.]|nr:D-lyxose/D-mannose family sugar isomerase [Paludibacter sp.]
MKRSEINKHIQAALQFFNDNKFYLPTWATYSPADWKEKYATHSEIKDNVLGWDLTDFGSNDYDKRGLMLFTIRNGNFNKDKKPYCEKIMIAGVGQETPMHFHRLKTEDIINRGGGVLEIEFYNSNTDGSFSDKNFTVKMDGIVKELAPGEIIQLHPGQSVCMESGVYHRFYGLGKPVLVGEVSTVNDDTNDNFFYEEVGRFPQIEEDEAPLFLLSSEYSAYL